jgi:hypothetical protein
VDVDWRSVPYGVEAVLIRTARLRTRTVIQSVQRRTIDRFDGFEASALIFEGSGWIQRHFGSDFGLEGAKNGLEQLEYDGDARRSPIGACTLASALRMAPEGLEWLRNSRELLRTQRFSKNEAFSLCADLEGLEWPRGIVADKLIVNDPCVINHGTIL